MELAFMFFSNLGGTFRNSYKVLEVLEFDRAIQQPDLFTMQLDDSDAGEEDTEPT